MSLSPPSERETALQRLTFAESDEGYRIRPSQQQEQWRGKPILKGSYQGAKGHICVHKAGSEVDSSTDPANRGLKKLAKRIKDSHLSKSLIRKTHNQQYTLGDAFCGAGGFSSGAKAAGLFVHFGFDKAKAPSMTYVKHFRSGGTHCIQRTCDEFINRYVEALPIGVLHMSPPCQRYSIAYTTEGKDDDDNQACLFSTRQLLATGKPRIATMEETPGPKEAHLEFLQIVLGNMIELGFSVRYKILNSKDYGIPQMRRRLLVLAAAPGEELPQFPEPTHGDATSGLQRIRYIADALAEITTRR